MYDNSYLKMSPVDPDAYLILIKLNFPFPPPSGCDVIYAIK